MWCVREHARDHEGIHSCPSSLGVVVLAPQRRAVMSVCGVARFLVLGSPSVTASSSFGVDVLLGECVIRLRYALPLTHMWKEYIPARKWRALPHIRDTTQTQKGLKNISFHATSIGMPHDLCVARALCNSHELMRTICESLNENDIHLSVCLVTVRDY